MLARRLHAIAVIGEAAGAACLIADLGRPARFHYMMRVFRRTSPMNLGTWILSAASASGGLALLGSLRGRRRLHPACCASAITGAMLSTYTAVLIGNTAIPVWRAARVALPGWFAALSTASLASLIELIGPARQLPRGYPIGAKTAARLGAVAVVRAARQAGVDRPLRRGARGGGGSARCGAASPASRRRCSAGPGSPARSVRRRRSPRASRSSTQAARAPPIRATFASQRASWPPAR